MDTNHNLPQNKQSLLLYIIAGFNYFLSKYLNIENLQMMFYFVSIISVILVCAVNLKTLFAKKKGRKNND